MKLLLTLLFLICMAPLGAQIANSNFENWIEFEGVLMPQGWETSAVGEVPAVTQDLDAYEGMYAMRVEALENGLGAFGMASTTFAIDEIPPSLDFYVKTATEFGGVSVEVTFYNDAEIVDFFYWSNAGEDIEQWTFASLPLEQTEPFVTSVNINVSAYVGDLVPGTAVISVDQMSFGSATGLNEENQLKLRLYPNPASDYFRLDEAGQFEKLEIRDLSGKLVKSYYSAQVQSDFYVGDLPQACYTVFAELSTGKTAHHKLLVTR